MEDNKQFYTIVLRHDTSTQWAVNNPILTLGEYAVEDDTHRVKRGDGETEWNDLEYEEFGLIYLITFDNLSGQVSDNEALQEEFDKKMSIDVFKDVGYQTISSITVASENGAIGKITKVTKNINTAVTDSNMLLIKSSDNSIQGYWSIDNEGVRILNLVSESSITDYEVGHRYYQDQLCYYKNILYRAVEDFEAEEEFKERHWVKLASLHSNDIKYNNLISGLEAENVKEAIDELQDLDSQKLKKTNRENKVYGTNELGEQFLYNKDDLRTVDSVNGKRATNQESKNIQLDASEINYDDNHPENGTIQNVLDSKVDKSVAGVGAKIVRDVQFNYNPQTGHIILLEDKFSLEDGSSATEEVEIDVVSEQELATNVQTINDRIDSEHTHFETRIQTEHDHFETKIAQEHQHFTDKIDSEHTHFETKIANEHQHFEDKIALEHQHFEDKIALEHAHFEDRIDDVDETINNRIDNEVATLNARIDDEVDTINTTIQTEHTHFETRIDEVDNRLDTKIDTSVNTLNTRITNEVITLNDRIDDEVDDLNDTISTQVQRLDGRINDAVTDYNTKINNAVSDYNTKINNAISDYNTKISNLTQTVANNKVDIETKLTNATNTLNNRIDQAVNTMNNNLLRQVDIINDRIDDEVDTLNDRITLEHNEINLRVDTEVSDLHTYIDLHDNLKIDKDIANNIVTAIEVATHDRQPTIKITSKNTENKQAVYDYVHFGTNGLIKVQMEDADHLVIDSTDIDTINTQQNSRLTNAESRLTAHDTQIATLLEHDVNHDRTLATHSSQIAMHETRLDTDEDNIRALQQDLLTETDTRILEDNALSGRITTNAINITTKVDKTFATNTNNKIVGKLESDILTGNELFNLKETLLSPIDGTASTERIKFISSDNTVIATRLSDGTIDLATNLDTDVNYFVTTDIINVTIASETVLDIANLTPTDKANVELQDIISDPEGTWGRVKSIDTANNTCTVVTFKKHAQAVWGTIKGNIANQQDLQNTLSDLQDTLESEINVVDNNKVDKVYSSNRVYGTDEYGNQTSYNKEDFGKVDTVNGLTPDGNKNVKVTAEHIQANTDTEVSDMGYSSGSIYTLLHSICMAVNANANSLNSHIRQYNSGGSYTQYLTTNTVDLATLDVVQLGALNSYVTFEREDGVVLMAKVKNDFSASSSYPTEYENFIADVESGNLALIGIPEQIEPSPEPEPDWALYTGVDIDSVTSSDNLHPSINTYEDLNNIYDVGLEIINWSETDTLYITGNSINIELPPSATSSIYGFETGRDITYYTNESAILELLSFSYEPEPSEPEEVFDILNEVDGQSDTYDGLGGTEEEIEAIFDEILGQGGEDEPEETFDILDDVMGTTGDTYDGLGGTEEEIEEIFDNILGNN